MYFLALNYFSQRTMSSDRPLDVYCLSRFPLTFHDRCDDGHLGFSRASFVRAYDQSDFDRAFERKSEHRLR